MAETREERKAMVAALKREIADSEAALKETKKELARISDLAGYEKRVVDVQRQIASIERNIKTAGDQLLMRIGSPAVQNAVQRRGPGRPKKEEVTPVVENKPEAKPEDSTSS